jgi:hypothetical protein
MARNPDRITKQTYFASGTKGLEEPQPIIDERRRWYGSLSGISQSNEILIPAMPIWQDVYAAMPGPLVEVLRLTLPRPEPVTLYFHPFGWDPAFGSNNRFRVSYPNHAEEQVNNVLSTNTGRIFIEWGVGSGKDWTYVDAAPGSLHIPSASFIVVSAYAYLAPYRLLVTSQVGYPHNNCTASWTFKYTRTLAPGNSARIPLPHYARDITVMFSGVDVTSEGYLRLMNSNNADMHWWYLRGPWPPNPQTIPYAPVSVPLGSGNKVEAGIVNTGGFNCTVCAIANVRVA